MAELQAMMRRVGFVPVVTIERAEHGPALARALIAGGLTMIEVTLRTEAALDALAAILRDVPEAEAGVGTVLGADELRRAAAAGAKFAFSPGFTPELLAAGRGAGIPFIPGVATAAEAMQARSYGYRVMKFFPAEQSGGIAALKALYGPLADLLFCPTGGITEANLRDYLAEPNVVAVGSSFVAPPADINAGQWGKIEERARKLRKLIAG